MQENKDREFFLIAAFALLIISLCGFAYAVEIELDDSAYIAGETVNFNIIYAVEDQAKTKLLVISPSENFELFGDNSGSHKFIPYSAGEHRIILQSKDGYQLAEASFQVYDKSAGDISQYQQNENAEKNMQLFPSLHQGAILIPKNEYFEGEEVEIFSSGTIGMSLYIEDDYGRKYEFLGERSDAIYFYPDFAGEYKIVLQGNGETFYQQFKVLERRELTDSSSILRIANSRNLDVHSSVKIQRKDSVDILVSRMEESRTEDTQNIYHNVNEEEIDEGSIYDADVQLRGSDIKRMKINSLKYEQGKTVGIDEFRSSETIDGKRALKNFAINLEGLNFTTAHVSITARGTVLYECKQWNFTTRTCQGAWLKKMDIVPGQEYVLEFTPGDPGYAEFGIASINTKKSIYEPGENAEIIIAVLDNFGFLVDDAFIELNVTNPQMGLSTFSTDAGEIFRISKGIYQTNYFVAEEGYYSLSVYAYGKNANNTMVSYFIVNSSHPFDIIRNSPASTDPFRSSFFSSIKIDFRAPALDLNCTQVNFTEKIPAQFTIINASGAEISRDDEFHFLKWIGLSDGSQVSYEAIPPLVTPELWELSSWIEYAGLIFDEARPWFLAVDPSAFYDPVSTISAGWNAGTGATFAEIDDGVRYSSIPDTNNYVSSLANSGVASNFGFSAVTEPFVDNITLWVYAGTGSNAQFTFNLYQNGTSRCSRLVARASPTGWYNCTWTAPSGNFSNISIYLGAVAKSGGGAATSAYVYAAYIDVGIGNYPPIVNLTKPDNNSLINYSTIDFNFTVSDDRDLFLKNCSLYGNFSGAWQRTATIFNVPNGSISNFTRTLSDGIYLWNVECYDQGNKFALSTANRTVTVNKEGPSITNYAVNSTIINQSKQVRFNASIIDAYGVSTAFISLKYPNSSTENITLSRTANEFFAIISNTHSAGLYNVSYIYANDTYNRPSELNISLTFTVVISPPSAFSLSSPANNNESENLMPNFSWFQTQDETFSNYTLLIGKDAGMLSPQFRYYTYQITNTSYLATFALDANSEYFWKVIASDSYGTATNSTETFRYVNDRISPSVQLISPTAASYSTTRRVLFQFTPNDANTLQQCSLYTNISGAWSVANSTSSLLKGQPNSIEYSLNEGTTLWSVNCRDLAGNNAFASENRTVIVDLTGPVVSLQVPSNNTNITNTNIINFTANASDVLAGVESCELIIDGYSEQTKASVIEGQNFTFTQFLTNGVYAWAVNCTDTNGIESSSLTRIVNVSSIDADVPIVLLNYPSAGEHIQSGTFSFNYTPQDATGIVNCSLYIDGAYNQTDISVQNLEPNYFPAIMLSEGYHSWNVTCQDSSANYNKGSAGQNFTIDLTNPEVALHSPENGAVANTSAVQFKYTPIDSNLLRCELWGNFDGIWKMHAENYSVMNNQENEFYSIIVDGIHKWNIRCVDKSLRSTFYSSNYTLRVDTSAPQYSSINIAPESPATYAPNKKYDFNISWTDNGELSTVLFENNFSGINMNVTVVESLGFYNFSVLNLEPGLYSYSWFANDTAGNRNFTSKYLYAVNKAPSSINLYLNSVNGNLTVDEDLLVNISGQIAEPSDGIIMLYVDGEPRNSGRTPFEQNVLFENPGRYNITAVYEGNENYTASQQTFFLTVLDKTSPEINLTHPQDGTTIASGDVIFQYNATDSLELSTCRLFINDLLNTTDDSVEQGANLFIVDISSGTYTWRVECNDSASNWGSSATNRFTAIDTTTINVNVATSGNSPERGEKINITTTVTDVFGEPLSTNVRTDIIYGFTRLGWWNSSWKKRMPLYFNETQGRNHINELAEINITGLNNQITDCQREIRIINNQSAEQREVPFKVYAGDNANWCYVAFIINLSANAVNQNNYYVYYNNSAAPSPGYNVITNAYTSYYAQLSAADEGTVTTPQNIVGYNDATSASISVSGGGAGAASAHGRGFINRTPGNIILNVDARYRYQVSSISGNWYLRYSTNDGTSYTNSFIGSTIQAKTTSQWANITGAYSSLTWSELNRTRLQGRVDKGSGSGTSTMLLYWVELNVTYRMISNITVSASGAPQEVVLSSFNDSNAFGITILEFDTAGRNYTNYSAVSTAFKPSYTSASSNVSFQIVKDITPPSVALISPSNNEERGEGHVSFVYKPFDTNLRNCSLYVGNSSGIFQIEYNTTPSNNVENNFIGANFEVGIYLWNVRCFDTENNSGFSSQNFTLNISAPNLRVRSQDIYFGNEEYVEGQSLTVFANITNAGLTDANNSFAVQFYSGNPEIDGIQVGADIILPNLSAGETKTISANYILTAGRNQIFIKVDPFNTVNETSSLDNLANANVSVDLYQYYYGNVSKNVALGASFAANFVLFDNGTVEGGSIYFADADSSFSFADLQALTKNSLGQIVGDDFSNIDEAMGTTTFDDSIRNVWGAGTDIPVETRSFNISQQEISGVPVVNSTISNNFVTGILWDTADDAGNMQYDSIEKEDVVFVTNINPQQDGEFGIYDSEIKIPATLKNYREGDARVVFYVEIK